MAARESALKKRWRVLEKRGEKALVRSSRKVHIVFSERRA
jgi:hypothetical protein